ncbi:MFS transporter [Brevundimonas lutea]|uniref:MFS transporter n=1 Tax=Brevundimonas lutea TaxID=2293980 RepID=UPI000F036C08|nr:MFS transporter [Brevundimonas lutea]
MTSAVPCLDDRLAVPARSPAQIALVLIALGMGGFAIGMAEFAAMSILPQFQAGLGLNAAQAGHVISAYAAGVVVGAPILAVMGARAPRWLLLIGFMALFAVGNVLSALAPTYEWMLAFRFLSGVPHGAYFGVAALVIAAIVPLAWRTRAVSTTLLGLTIATVIGVPIASAASQAFGWRWTFAGVAVVAILTMALVFLFAPRDGGNRAATPMRELTALKRGQVWLTLGVGAIGFGGLFAVYAYLASTLEAVTQVGPGVLPWVFAVFGLGMVVGNLVAGWATDRFGMAAAGGLLLWSAVSLSLYPAASQNLWSILIVVFMIGGGGGLGSVLQTRLMDVAGEAQTLAAALNHSAFNAANALGPFLAGLALTAGWGLAATGWVGVALSVGGLVIWAVAVLDARRRRFATVD